MSETALAVVPKDIAKTEEPSASALMQRAFDVSDACRKIVLKTAMELQGKKYIRCEGWLSIAAAFNCVPSIREVIEEERGIRAISELRRPDGTVIATAEGYVGLDEPRWSNQPMYARRGMASTRAISRVCRQVFSFVVVMIDENLSPTPAEEVPTGGDVVDGSFAARASPPSARPSPPAGRPQGERSSRTKVPYGKNRNRYLCDLELADLEWCLGAFQKSVDARDPKWHEANLARLAAAKEELARRKA